MFINILRYRFLYCHTEVGDKAVFEVTDMKTILFDNLENF